MGQQQNDLRPMPFNKARLKEIRRLRGKYDAFQSFWDELEILLKCKHPKSNDWERMENDDVVLGEVWSQPIGEIYYKHTVHKFSYLYVKSQGLAIGRHGHNEPANGGKQTRKVKEWYVFPDGSIHFCGKDQEQIEEQIKNINQCCTMDKQRFDIDGIRFSQMIWGSYFMNGRLIQVGRLQYEVDEEVPESVKNFKDGSYIYIHIPKGDSLNIDDVNASIKNAKEKIEKFYPEIEIPKLQFYTNTWLLSNELDSILDENSNIIKFKNKFNIIDQTENTEDFLNFVFQEKGYNINYENLKEETILQRKLKEYLLENKKLHIGLGILKD